MKTITSVPKHIAIPEGATHYDSALLNPFSKIIGTQAYRWHDNQWNLLTNTDRLTAAFISRLTPIKFYDVPENAQRVMTPYGPGNVVQMDYSARKLIDLDHNPFNFSPVAIWSDELQPINTY